MTKAEVLERLADMTQQRDDAKAKIEKLIERFDEDAEFWFPFAARLDGEQLKAALDERDTLRERLAGNMQGIGHISDKLRTLRQVGDQVWSNVDRSTPASHPANNVAESALIARGWSPSLAKAGASIIRPEWAAKGRKAEE